MPKQKREEYADKIFALIQEYGPLNRYEIAAALDTCDRNHTFSYGLQDVWKAQGRVEKNGEGKFGLTDKACLKLGGRPATKPLTQEMKAKIELGAKQLEAWKVRSKAARKKKTKAEKAKKCSENYGADTSESEEVNENTIVKNEGTAGDETVVESEHEE